MEFIDLYSRLYSLPTSSLSEFISSWRDYINNDDICKLCIDDALKYDLDKQVIPIIKSCLASSEKLKTAYENFLAAYKIIIPRFESQFGSVDMKIVLYLGLCNGAGWVVQYNGKKYILFGLEKIIELGWHTYEKISNLLSHELGHVYYFEFTKKWNEESQNSNIMNLFEEGFAEYVATLLCELPNSRGQKWSNWCQQNMWKIKREYLSFINENKDTSVFFGDWRKVLGHSDLGYYLGHQFIIELRKDYSLHEIALLPYVAIKERFFLFLK